MPKIDKKSTLLRQWEMMRMLTVSRWDRKTDGGWDKASEIAARLNDKGYEVSIRTVQRDLKELSEIFPIELIDKNPRDYGWRWTKGANLDIPGMSISEALAMQLVETHLRQMLPASMLDGLQGVFSLADEKLTQLKKEGGNKSVDWLKKVRVVPPSLPLLPPHVNQEVQSVIYKALLESRQLSVAYQSNNSEHPKEYLLHPLGLIMRGAVSYLVATARDYKEIRLYALHRFKKAEILSDAANVPKGFNLDNEISRGLAEFHQGEPIQLVINCSAWLAVILAETPLSADQISEPDENGWVRITANVNDTWQLRWWLLGLGSGVEVLSPKKLRGDIVESLTDAVSYYT
jgi:predicted DNA-binding transcriptional regulator YafY